MCEILSDQPTLCYELEFKHAGLSDSNIIKDNSFFVDCHPLLDCEEIDYTINIVKVYLRSYDE